MSVNIIGELRTFFVFLVTGISIGILFDFFRIIRRLFKVSNVHTYIEDILFGIFTALILIFVTFIYNNGNIRLFMLLAIFIGIMVYLKSISNYFIKVNVFIITGIRTMLLKVFNLFLKPLNCIFKVVVKIFTKFFIKFLNKPFMLLVINIRKRKEKSSYKKSQKKRKKLFRKKDFSI